MSDLTILLFRCVVQHNRYFHGCLTLSTVAKNGANSHMRASVCHFEFGERICCIGIYLDLRVMRFCGGLHYQQLQKKTVNRHFPSTVPEELILPLLCVMNLHFFNMLLRYVSGRTGQESSAKILPWVRREREVRTQPDRRQNGQRMMPRQTLLLPLPPPQLKHSSCNKPHNKPTSHHLRRPLPPL